MYEKYHDALQKSELCQNIDMKRYELFLQKLRPDVKKHQKQEYIIREGDPVDFTGIIVRGSVLQKRDNASGVQSVYSILNEGSSFGIAIIMMPERKVWPYDYVAKTDCTILSFARENVEREFLNPEVFTNEIFVNWLKCICRMLERNVIALRSLKNTSVRQKILAYLNEMYFLNQKHQFELSFSREELAAYLNMPQSSLSREMSEMKREGIIDFHKSTIKILDLEVLKDKTI